MKGPGIILTSQFTTPSAKSFSQYVDYMTRKEAMKEREEDLTQEEKVEWERINRIVEQYQMKMGSSQLNSSHAASLSPKEAEAHVILQSRNQFQSETDYIKYISYMGRQYALEQKKELTETDHMELELLKNKTAEFTITNDGQRNEPQDEVKPGVFSIEKDHMTEKDIEDVNEMIRKAQNNGSVFYQDVISFDTDFLIQQHLYDPERNELNEERIRHASKKMMGQMFKDEDIPLGYWFASIHRNTDHIHIHYGTVETQNTRPLITVEEDGEKFIAPKGMRKQKTIDNMKSVFANELVDRTTELSRISFLRNTLVQSIREDYLLRDNLKENKLLEDVYKELPFNTKDWKYGSRHITDETREKIDKLTESFIKDNPDYQEYMERTKEESEFRKSLFGDTSRSEKDYEGNKKKDLQKRLGNALLKQLKVNSQAVNHNREVYKHRREYEKTGTKKEPTVLTRSHSKPVFSYKDMYQIKRAIHDDFEKYRAQKDYEYMQQRIAQEQQRNEL
ncbi:MobP2 family relaxase [Fictibacillus enclensis]|uniref:MobP2 family relaxase n=1 Tax=Fictibacillus enclensis TaxID=1017270 RepID=UPI0025A1A1CD|nr:MobP2 family relaxase [Fictibacillus enclensis]MDM5335772.1 MobP2 family relaxase [Fictibacillus enclensis]